MISSHDVMDKLVKLKFDVVRGGNALGAHGLSFQFIQEVTPQVEGNEIFVEFHWMDIYLESSVVGRAFSQGIKIVRFFNHAQTDGHLSFFLDIDRARLEALENFRNGQDLKLTFWVHGIARINGTSESINHREEVVLNQRQWTDALNQTDYLKYFTFEAPLPASNDSEFKEVKAYFSKAQQLFLQGHYPETLLNCRNAMEALEKGLDISSLITDARHDFCGKKTARENMTLEERIRLLFGATKSIAHLGAHSDGQPDLQERVMRKEAKLVLTMTGALLAHALGL